MQKELIKSEKEMIKSNINLLTKRLNYLMYYCQTENINIIDKEVFKDLLKEIAQNVLTETQNYLYLI